MAQGSLGLAVTFLLHSWARSFLLYPHPPLYFFTLIHTCERKHPIPYFFVTLYVFLFIICVRAECTVCLCIYICVFVRGMHAFLKGILYSSSAERGRFRSSSTLIHESNEQSEAMYSMYLSLDNHRWMVQGWIDESVRLDPWWEISSSVRPAARQCAPQRGGRGSRMFQIVSDNGNVAAASAVPR